MRNKTTWKNLTPDQLGDVRIYKLGDDWYIEDTIGGANVDKYHYEVNFLPEMIVPVTFTSND